MSTASFDVTNASSVSRVSGTDRPLGPAAYRDEDFPGCESFHLPASELDTYEGRLEFWDGDDRDRRGRCASPPPSSTRSRPGGSCK